MAIDPIVLKEKIMEHLTLVVMNSAEENTEVKAAMAAIPDPVEGQTQEEFSDAVWGVMIEATNNHWVSNEDMWLAISEGIAEALDASGGVGSQYIMAPVRLVAVENVTARQGLLQIDGVTLVAGDRVLLTAQNDSRQNGLYVAASGAWVRSDDCDEVGELLDGAIVLVEEGTDHANTLWAVVTEDPIVPGSDPVTFVELIGTGTGPEGPPGPPGMYWRGTWSSSTIYAVTDAVQYEGSSYIGKVSNNQNHQPDVSPSFWDLLAEQGDPGAPGAPGPQGDPGLVWKGTWDSGTTYAMGDAVQHNGSSFISLQDNNLNKDPETETAYWDVLAEKGDPATAAVERVDYQIVGTGSADYFDHNHDLSLKPLVLLIDSSGNQVFADVRTTATGSSPAFRTRVSFYNAPALNVTYDVVLIG